LESTSCSIYNPTSYNFEINKHTRSSANCMKK
jgi:hypothetical protein